MKLTIEIESDSKEWSSNFINAFIETAGVIKHWFAVNGYGAGRRHFIIEDKSGNQIGSVRADWSCGPDDYLCDCPEGSALDHAESITCGGCGKAAR